MSKNYITFINDHSGSMGGSKAAAALVDYNANIDAVKTAATKEMLDTVVSVIGLGLPTYHGHVQEVQRQIVISNPHVLKPMAKWPTPGGTPLYDAIGDAIELMESLPDYNSPDVSFLVFVTTDGGECHSVKYDKFAITRRIKAAQDSGRWTFVFRVPAGVTRSITDLGVPVDNIQAWDNTAEGLKKTTEATAQAMTQFYATRSAGARSSSAFYANAAAVDTSSLVDISKEVSLYVVPQDAVRLEIRDFVLKHRMEYLKGAAFYQLTKTESRVSHTKLIAVRDRATGKFYAGADARKMIGLPTDRNARLHPGDHGNYDIFIQSESVNRLLVPGTGLMYWAKIGKQFTEADLAYLKPKALVAPAAPAVVQLPAVPVSTKPTPSPIPPAKKERAKKYFETRQEAREYCRKNGNTLKDACKDIGGHGPNGERWFVFL
jgi:hypothetical protein